MTVGGLSLVDVVDVFFFFSGLRGRLPSGVFDFFAFSVFGRLEKT